MGQTIGFEPTTSESQITIVQRPAMRARWVHDRARRSTSELCLTSSTRLELHQRPHDPGSHALAARATRRGEKRSTRWKAQELNPTPLFGVAHHFRNGCRAIRDVTFQNTCRHRPQWRESNPAFVRAYERIQRGVSAADRRFTGSTAVAAEGIEPSRRRVWAATVPSTSCGHGIAIGIGGGTCTRVHG